MCARSKSSAIQRGWRRRGCPTTTWRRRSARRRRSMRSGGWQQNYKQLLVVTDQEAHTPDDIGNIVVTTAAGPGVRVRDLGTVAAGTEDHTHIVAGDGRPAALINITRQTRRQHRRDRRQRRRRHAGDRADACRRACASKPVYDQAALVRDAVTSVRDAMLIGAAARRRGAAGSSCATVASRRSARRRSR